MALGLQGTKTVLNRLQIEFPPHIIHVAGSNGKGTVCALMSTAFTLNNIDNVLFTSPHVARIEERIRRNGTPISSHEFDEALNQIQRASIGDENNSAIELTFFEITYLIAMITSAGSEVLLLETGLGGRLDATRSGPATASLVTAVSREHMEILGSNLPKIAREKAAIARPSCPIIIRDPEDIEVRNAMEEETLNAGNTSLDEIQAPAQATFVPIPSGVGVREEAAVMASALFETLGFSTASIEQAKSVLRWPARLHFLNQKETSTHPYLLDAAHNPSGIRRVLPELEELLSQHAPNSNWTLIFGTSPQHDLADFLAPLHDLCQRLPPKQILLTQPHGGRYPGVDVNDLLEQKWTIKNPLTFASADQAIEYLATQSEDSVGLVVSLGSLYLQGNILNFFNWASDENLSLVAKH